MGQEFELGGGGGFDLNKIEELDEDLQEDNIEGDWINMCQVNSKPVEPDDISFATLEDSKLAENHIIICGMVENIRHFVMPLRADHLNNPSPIVILHHSDPTEQ